MSAPGGYPGAPVQPVPPGLSPGTGPHRPVPPTRSRSIVADLDVPERDLLERPNRLVPRSSALLVVCLLVLAVAGGGGYLVWRQTQVEEPTPASVEAEPTPEPEPPLAPSPSPEAPPEEPAAPEPSDTPAPAPDPTPTPTPSAPAPTTSKAEKSGSSAKKPTTKTSTSTSSTKTGTSPTKSGTSSTKKADPADDALAKRKEQADAADPGRVLVELEYLSAIDKALKAKNWAQALAYIDQHDRELPGGQLVDKFDERRIRALCGMGRTSEAQSKAAQILAKRPASKVKAALDESCK
jgi:type IV secretory pathway VirB10-like protein